MNKDLADKLERNGAGQLHKLTQNQLRVCFDALVAEHVMMLAAYAETVEPGLGAPELAKYKAQIHTHYQLEREIREGATLSAATARVVENEAFEATDLDLLQRGIA